MCTQSDPLRQGENLSYPERIRDSGLTIYDVIALDSRLWIPSGELTRLLNDGLRGLSLEGLPLRTRSKAVKSRICTLLGYPVPQTFRRERPRFPSQNLDVYVQKSHNLQIWNDLLEDTRRYALVHLNEHECVDVVSVVTGKELRQLIRTGTLTHKFQARIPDDLVSFHSQCDTATLQRFMALETEKCFDFGNLTSASPPSPRSLLPVDRLFPILLPVLQWRLSWAASLDERRRGACLQELVAHRLGYVFCQDNGQFPDFLHQLLEIKLQTSPTIDLGHYSPHRPEKPTVLSLSSPQYGNWILTPDDVRYAIFKGHAEGKDIVLDHLFVCTGADFTNHFELCGGRGSSAKVQIPLPDGFFTS